MTTDVRAERRGYWGGVVNGGAGVSIVCKVDKLVCKLEVLHRAGDGLLKPMMPCIVKMHFTFGIGEWLQAHMRCTFLSHGLCFKTKSHVKLVSHCKT